MKRQKSFQNDMPCLYLVATPIGNLGEMSQRAIEVLKEVSVIAAEDTRTSGVLLKHFGIETRLISHHAHNEKESAQGLVKLLNSGQSIALISDAGYPSLSDPGYIVVQEVIQAGYNVVPVSGSNAALNALVASGIKPYPFVFYGFLPLQEKQLNQELNQLKAYPLTLVFYEAPHRIKKTLERMQVYFGDRKACIAREITKRYEEFARGSLSELMEIAEEFKGEIVLVVEGNKDDLEKDIDLTEVHSQIQAYIDHGISANEAIKRVAKETGLKRNDIYTSFHTSKEQA